MPVAMWSIKQEKPQRLDRGHEWVEARLEEWVRSDPSMVAERLRWIGQQVCFPDRSRLDLVGISPAGGIVLAELKRGVLGISTLAQALGYVLRLGAWDADSLITRLNLSGDDATAISDAFQSKAALDVSVLLIGTGREPELDRAAAFLVASGLSIPVSIVTFTPFVDAAGEIFLTREIEEHEVALEDTSPRQRSTREAKVEWVLEMARDSGVHGVFKAAIASAQRLGLRVKPWTKSITVTTRGRTLIYLRPHPSGQVSFGYGEETLAELYGADPSTVRGQLGENWVDMSEQDALARVLAFENMMKQLQAAPATDDPAEPVPSAIVPTQQTPTGEPG